MEQDIRFCTTADGVRIAYASVGHGPAYVWVPGWISHLEVSWENPWFRATIESAARHFMVVRYDKRGTGLSDRDFNDYSLDARIRDLEAVVNDLKLEQFVLHGASEGGPVAIAYTARRPRRVSRLILHGTFSSGTALASSQQDVGNALMALIRAEWGLGSQTMSNLLTPGASTEQVQSSARQQREAASPEFAATMIEGMARVDVTALLPKIDVPTLVIHGRADAAIPFEMGRQIASAIPGARLYAFEGGHMPMDPEVSAGIVAAQRDFLMPERDPQSEGAREKDSRVQAAAAQATPVTPSLVTILFTDMEGSTALTQRLGDAKAQEVLRAHNAIIRDALAAHGGSETKHTGDGIMASFGSAVRALECAVAIQKAFADPESTVVGAQGLAPLRPDEGQRLENVRVRIGLNAGEPVAEDGPDGRRDLFGATVQLAARVCNRAEPGQVLVSNVVRELAMGKGFLFHDISDFLPKGFEEPVRLYEVRS